jgi:hypothetical protein
MRPIGFKIELGEIVCIACNKVAMYGSSEGHAPGLLRGSAARKLPYSRRVRQT